MLRRTRGAASSPNPLETVRTYTQRITTVVELGQLVDAACRALCDALQVRYAVMLLVHEEEASAAFHLVSSAQPIALRVPKTHPLYQHFAIDQALLTRSGLKRFPPLTPEEQALFGHERIDAYAPILVENHLIGVFGAGTKQTSGTLTLDDLELLATLANQTGVAIRNARLVEDLRLLNDQMQLLNSTLETARDQAHKLDAVKTDFITIASHELRTPLSQITGYVDILDALNEQGIIDPDRLTGTIGNLRKAAERTEELIAAMLDVSKIDVNAMDLRFGPVAIESAVRSAIEPLNEAIKQRRLALTARGLRGLPMLQADQQRLVQALRGVLVNAIKFTPDGGRIEITAHHEVAKTPDGTEGIDTILLAITDTGVGIAKENLDLVFRKFFRAYNPMIHSTGAYKFMGAGPGLGLTIARGVIEGHHGQIWAESSGYDMDALPGTTFYIRLPVVQPGSERRVLSIDMDKTGKIPRIAAS